MARQPLRVKDLTPEAHAELEALYQQTRDARLRTRAQMILLSAEESLVAHEIARLVRMAEQTVRNWIKRFNAEDINGLKDAPRPGGTPTVTPAYCERLLEVVRRLGLGTPVKKGKELAVRCPLHEDNNPSLRLNPTKQLWYCAPCVAGGDAIKLYMRARRIEFAEAVRELAA